MRPPVWPIPETQAIPGSAVVRLINATSQENAYTVCVKCDAPYWQESWVSIIGLPPSPDKAENAPPAGKADQRGPHDRWIKLFVPRGGTRDVLLRFNVPESAEARAGRYPYLVEVETQVTGGNRRSDRTTELRGVAVIRPYYRWDIDMLPEQPRVGIRHRSAQFETVVTNESNDWLYCELQIPRAKDMHLDAPTLRVAVPPPEPGELLPARNGDEPRLGVQRSVPIRATTQLRTIRGEVTPQSIMLTALRVDAPSVPLPLNDPSYSGWGAVVAEETTETKRLPGDRAINYCPPIPARLTDFFTRSGDWLRNLIMVVIGAVVAFNLLIVMYENVWHNNVMVEPLSTRATAGGQLGVKGEWLLGSKITLAGEDVPTKYSTDPTRATITVPMDLDGKVARLKVQRFVRFLPFLTALLPSYESKIDVQVGSLPHVVQAGNAFIVLPTRQYMPGELFTMQGGGLGPLGKVYLDGEPVSPASWSDSAISAMVPSGTPPGPLSVAIYTPDNRPILQSGTINVGDPLAAQKAAAAAAAAKSAALQLAKQQSAAQAAAAAQSAQSAQQQSQQNPGNTQMAAQAAQQQAAKQAAQQIAAQQAAAAAAADQQRQQQAAALAAQAAQQAAQQRAQAAAARAAQIAAAKAAGRKWRLPKVAQNPPPNGLQPNGSTPPPPVDNGTGNVTPPPQVSNANQSEALTTQGYQLANNLQYPDAVNALQQAVTLDPQNQQARDGLVTTLNNEATDLNNQATQDQNAGQYSAADGLYQQAISLRMQALNWNPNDAVTKHKLAVTYYNAGVNDYNNNQNRQAVQQFQLAVKWAPPPDTIGQNAQTMIQNAGGH
jgi:tetratricopeptide (TPR) repeat protein